MSKESMQSLGGKARAKVLTEEQRKDIARGAAAVRWGIPKATHQGKLNIGGYDLNCAVLENGVRVLSERSIATALGIKGGGAHWKRKKQGSANLPEYFSVGYIQEHLKSSLIEKLSTPIRYLSVSKKESSGLEASVLQEICDFWIDLDKKGVLQPQHKEIADKALVLLRGFAKVGIIALVDEATGYQYERDRVELQRILEAYVSGEFLPWTKRFPNEFYEQLFRLRDWNYSPLHVKRPILIGKLTNKIVYKKLPAGVLEELKAKNPITPKGYRKHRYHQFLTEDIGNPHLERHLASVITLMRVSKSWDEFERLLEEAFPSKRAKQFELELRGSK